MVEIGLDLGELVAGEHRLGIAAFGVQDIDGDDRGPVAAYLIDQPGHQTSRPRPPGSAAFEVLLGDRHDGQFGPRLPGPTPLESPVQEEEVRLPEHVEP